MVDPSDDDYAIAYTPEQSPDTKLGQERIVRLHTASQTLAALAAEPISRLLEEFQADELTEYSIWLSSWFEKINSVAKQYEEQLQMSLGNLSAMKEMNKSFDPQYLSLQQNAAKENRQFTLMSNIMKTKHDTAKSAINNIR